jgi:phosphoribosylanthranilate isomerase
VTVVKVCGVCDGATARAAADAGADWLGLHFCSSPRRVSAAEARAILEGLEARPLVVGVFLNQTPEEVAETVKAVGLDAVQLHGSEPLGFKSPRPVIKALKVRDGRVPEARGWPDPILLDSWSADQRGGTGRGWNFEAARPLIETRQVILAGGLDPENVGPVVERYRPYGVDVSSGVEAAVRVKDPNLVRAFVQAVRQADERR